MTAAQREVRLRARRARRNTFRFSTPREAFGFALAKRRGPRASTPSYSDHVQSSHDPEDLGHLIRAIVYGEGDDSLAVAIGSELDAALQAWATRRCPGCGGYAPLDREGLDHRCTRGAYEGKLFWTPARVQAVRNLERRLRSRLRDLGLIPEGDTRRGKLVTQEPGECVHTGAKITGLKRLEEGSEE